MSTTYADAGGLERALAAALAPELVEFGEGTRAIYATDSSNYRQVPIGVVFPRSAQDVAAALKVCAAHDVPVLGRGGGTSLAGQACNTAVVFDFSRHMNRILDIDPKARTARVQPGVVLDDLRHAAEAHGLTFGPDPATHAWCTLGGMIGNNSCGTHALSAGKTVDNVLRLRVACYEGGEYEFGEYDEAAYAALVREGAPEAGILGSLREIGRRHADLVRERYPDIPRRVSGYNLEQLLPGQPLNVARLLVGTESTCALVTEAVVSLAPSPGHRRLIVLGYPSVFDAADAVPSLLPHGLLGLEGFDVTLVRQMRSRSLNVEHLPVLPDLDKAIASGSGGWLLAEVGGSSAAEADAAAQSLITALPSGVSYRLLVSPADQRGAWAIRESGLGATAIREDGGHNAEGWEDGAVPPERLGEYLRAISELWDEFGYSGAWYGHFGQGCVHTRNNFDLHTKAGLRAYRAYVERAADLVVSLGGSLSGEHGDGQARGELLERMYGPELVDAFRQVKAVFDPRGRMNPGKVVDPYPLDTNLRQGPGYRRARPEPGAFFALLDDESSLQHAAERCVGVGRCRRDDAGVMCPSYRVTRDEKHSTRGRAKLLVEMFQGEVTPNTWRNKEVRDALDLCLACKGCAVDCPTHVDMATYKSEFLAHHYRRRLRPRAMYVLALTPWIARIAARVPRLANAVLNSGRFSALLRRSAGITTQRPAPVVAAKTLRRSHRGAELPDTPSVVLWPDTFTDAYRPEIAEQWRRVFESVGERVAVPTEWACCGRPLYDAGMLKLAKRTLRGLLDALDTYIAAGVPIVVPEPSCLAAFRDELPGLLPDDPRAEKLASLARSPAEHLLSLDADDLSPLAAEEFGVRVLVHPHCHARAAHSADADRRILAQLGYTVDVLDAGCCGLAGSFGFRAEHEPLSRQIGEEQWLTKIDAALWSEDSGGRVELLLDGFSCATQFSHLAHPSSPRPSTLAELIGRNCT
ncbi:FAD-binding oxidoreductase [Actinospica sp. MGRD01-02]|uniref:FAD-binding oxidoreductase n=1 Tax=Actinospica acidithermotolerans TaxID=2828514 RepID=A0A941EEE7_9ACTN|nr:FAD-binding and (Fe-S)-binding domain-containing protein [Actinospica acidithermotolerans]MBR7828952.1 FAD-binding oxidoreductase [Actinospica acidithermotolerans]